MMMSIAPVRFGNNQTPPAYYESLNYVQLAEDLEEVGEGLYLQANRQNALPTRETQFLQYALRNILGLSPNQQPNLVLLPAVCNAIKEVGVQLADAIGDNSETTKQSLRDVFGLGQGQKVRTALLQMAANCYENRPMSAQHDRAVDVMAKVSNYYSIPLDMLNSTQFNRWG